MRAVYTKSSSSSSSNSRSSLSSRGLVSITNNTTRIYTTYYLVVLYGHTIGSNCLCAKYLVVLVKCLEIGQLLLILSTITKDASRQSFA